MYYRERNSFDPFLQGFGAYRTHFDYKGTSTSVQSAFNSTPVQPQYAAEMVDYCKSLRGDFTKSSTVFPSYDYKNSFKPVSHDKWEVYVETAPAYFKEYTGSFHYIIEHGGRLSHQHHYWCDPNYSGAYSPGHSNLDMVRLGQTHLPNMLRDSKLLNLEQVDMASFLAELREVRNLTDMVKFQRDVGDVSGKFLGFEFGVLPLVGDIKNIYNNISKQSDVISKWNDMASKGKTRAYHKLLREETKTGSNERFNGYDGTWVSKGYKYVYEWETTVIEKSHIYVRPKGHVKPTNLRLNASIWGFNRPLATVWNLIPLSFAVDWVVNIGDIIDQFEYSEPTLDFDIISAGVSRKTTTRIVCKVYLSFQKSKFGPDLYVGQSVMNRVQFNRAPVNMPALMDTLANQPIGPLEFSHELNGMQIALSAALVHQIGFKGIGFRS